MGFWRNIFGLGEAVASAPTFAVDAESIPPEVFGLESYATSTAPAPRIDRRSAIQVPAVKRCRDLIAGTLGGLPLDLFAPDRTPARSTLFDQPERNVPRSVTMTRLFEDLFFEGIAWWRVTELGWTDFGRFPTFVKRIDPRLVEVREAEGKVYIGGRHVPDDELIRFDSPTDAMLKAGARAIRTCLQLDAAAANASDGVPPVQYFVPADGADPAEDDDIKALISDWQIARRDHSTAYIPAALKLMDAGWDPKKLQLVEQRQHAVLDIARVAGVDPEELGVSTTSRTYANQFDRRKAFTDMTLGLYMHAAEDRLSMGDVNPRGYYAKFSLDAFLRSDPAGRYAAYKAGLEVGALDQADIRELEDKPPLTTDTTETPGATASVTPLRSAM